MNLFKRLIRYARSRGRGTLPVREGGTLARRYREMSAMSVATVYRCVRLLCDSVAVLPIAYKRKDDNGIFRSDDTSSLWYLLNVRPDSYMTAYDLKVNVVRDMTIHGNAYLVPQKDYTGTYYTRLAYVPATTVSHNMDTDTYVIDDNLSGIHGEFSEAEILHFKGFGDNPKTGMSVLQYAAQTLEIAQAGNAEALDRLEHGGTVRGFLAGARGIKGFGEYRDAEVKKVAEDIDSFFANGGRIRALNGDLDFKGISASAAEMQFMEMRRFAVREICRAFGVHPSYVFDDTSNNYKSAETASAAFLTTTLNPILVNIEQELRGKLCTPVECLYRKFEFDRSQLLICDLDSKAGYQAKLIGAGLATVNELRAMEDMPPVKGGDTCFVSANLSNIITQ